MLAKSHLLIWCHWYQAYDYYSEKKPSMEYQRLHWFEEGSFKLVASDLGVHGSNRLLLFCQVCLHDGEQSLYANAHLKENFFFCIYCPIKIWGSRNEKVGKEIFCFQKNVTFTLWFAYFCSMLNKRCMGWLDDEWRSWQWLARSPQHRVHSCPWDQTFQQGHHTWVNRHDPKTF